MLFKFRRATSLIPRFCGVEEVVRKAKLFQRFCAAALKPFKQLQVPFPRHIRSKPRANESAKFCFGNTALAVLFMSFAVVGCKTLPPESGVFRGHYTNGFEVSRFKPCDRKEVWWVEPRGPGQETLFDTLQSLGVDTKSGRKVYAEVRGDISPTGQYGHLGAYDRELRVVELITAHKPSPVDCK